MPANVTGFADDVVAKTTAEVDDMANTCVDGHRWSEVEETVTSKDDLSRREAGQPARERSISWWQERLDSATSGRWAHALIPVLSPWLESMHLEGTRMLPVNCQTDTTQGTDAQSAALELRRTLTTSYSSACGS